MTSHLTVTRLLCALTLTAAAAQAQNPLSLQGTLTAPTYAATGTVSNCASAPLPPSSPTGCATTTLGNANVTISSPTAVILGPGFTAAAGASSSLTVMIATGPTITSPTTPLSGTGTAENFAPSYASSYWNNNGWIDIIIGQGANNWPYAANNCYVQYSQAANTMYLVDDTGTTLLTGVIPGSGAAFNSQCTLDGAASSVTLTGNTLQVTFGITFRSINPAFQGTQDVWIQSSDGTGQTVEWDHIGTWDVTGFTPISVSPGPPPQSGASQQITVSAVSPNWANDGAIDILINGAQNAANSCYVQYSQADNSLTLIGNDGVTPLSPITPGSGSQQNSQCILNGSSSYASLSGTTLTVTFGLTFLPAFDTPPVQQTIYAVASDGAGENTELQPWATIYVGNPDFTLSITAPNPAVVMAAGSLGHAANPATYSVSVTPRNGFSDTVNLTSALPAGFTTTFVPNGAGVTTLSIWAPAGASGNITAYVTGTGATTGITHTASGGALSVQDFTVTLSPSYPSSAPTVALGGSQSFTINASGINGFAGNVGLTYSPTTCPATALNFPSQVAAGSAATMTITPEGSLYNTVQCTFQISASVNGDFHYLSGAVNVSPSINFTVTLPANQSTLTATPGTQPSTVVFTPTVTSTATNCVNVQFVATGQPVGVSVTVPDPNTVCGTQTENITVTVQPGTPPGTYPLTIKTIGNNGTDLYIYPVLQVGSGSSTFSISVSPPQTTSPGGTAQYTITVNGTAGLGNVTLTETGGPPGAAVQFNNGSTNATVTVPGSATMAVATPSNAALGSYAVKLTGMLGTLPQYATAVTNVAPAAAASITSPVPGQIASGQNIFRWNSGVGATQYTLTVGSAPGGTNYYSANVGLATSATVTIPQNASSIYATLGSLTASGVVLSQSYMYSTASVATTITLSQVTVSSNDQELQATIGRVLSGTNTLTGCSPPAGVMARIIPTPQLALGITATSSATLGQGTITCSTSMGEQLFQLLDVIGGPEVFSVDTDPYPAMAGYPAVVSISGAGFGSSDDDNIPGLVQILDPLGNVIGGNPVQWNDDYIVLDSLTFMTPGTYTAVVTTEDEEDTMASGSFDVIAPPSPALQLLMGGVNITGTTQNVVVGQQINLSLSTATPDLCSSATYSPFGDYIGNWTASAANKQVAQVLAPNLNAWTTSFYWKDASTPSGTVTVSLTCGANQYSAGAQFNVTAPTGLNVTSPPTLGLAAITPNPLSDPVGIPMLVLGGLSGQAPPLPTPGIAFSAAVSSAPAGTLSYVQILDNLSITLTAPTAPPTVALCAANGLDGSYPYPSFVLAANTQTNDNPNVALVWPPYKDVQYYIQAKMYLLWQPTLPNSIPVPLGYFPWNWFGHANYDYGSSTYLITPDSNAQANAGVFMPSNAYPTWTTYYPLGSQCPPKP